MANIVCEILVTESPLEASAKNFHGDAGAMIEFWGVVRRFEGGREIDGIDPHRGEGFRAAQWIVDELKKKVPIWKRPRFRTDKEDHAAYNAAITI